MAEDIISAEELAALETRLSEMTAEQRESWFREWQEAMVRIGAHFSDMKEQARKFEEREKVRKKTAELATRQADIDAERRRLHALEQSLS